MTNLFLDCEWADVLGSELVSIALVTQDGKKEFYAERASLPADPTPWVAMVVYPLLDRGPSAMSDCDMGQALRDFVGEIDHPRICYDYPKDRELCEWVLGGSGESIAPDSNAPEPPIDWLLLTDTGPALERWWKEHPQDARRRHHALVDAKALRAAWFSLWGI